MTTPVNKSLTLLSIIFSIYYKSELYIELFSRNEI
ncbi:hypothetical protein ACVW0P_000855 [Mucilaginibacter sp. UYNi724]